MAATGARAQLTSVLFSATLDGIKREIFMKIILVIAMITMTGLHAANAAQGNKADENRGMRNQGTCPAGTCSKLGTSFAKNVKFCSASNCKKGASK